MRPLTDQRILSRLACVLCFQVSLQLSAREASYSCDLSDDFRFLVRFVATFIPMAFYFENWEGSLPLSSSTVKRLQEEDLTSEDTLKTLTKTKTSRAAHGPTQAARTGHLQPSWRARTASGPNHQHKPQQLLIHFQKVIRILSPSDTFSRTPCWQRVSPLTLFSRPCPHQTPSLTEAAIRRSIPSSIW